MKKPLAPAGAEVPCSTRVLGSGGRRGAETQTSPSPGETAQSLCLPRAPSEHIPSPSLSPSESHREPRHPRRSHCILSQTSHCKQPPLPIIRWKGLGVRARAPEGTRRETPQFQTAHCTVLRGGLHNARPRLHKQEEMALWPGPRPGAPASACLPASRWLSGGRAPRTHRAQTHGLLFGSRSIISAH